MEKQGDEEILKILSSWIINNFRVNIKTKIPLKELFPEPEKKHLRKFWNNNSHADIAIFRHRKLLCIVEPGGKAHFSDKKQRTRDKKKDAICRINNIKCLRVSNGIIRDLDLPVTKQLFRKFFYS